MAELGTAHNNNDHLSNFVDLHAKNNQLRHLFSDLFQLSRFVSQVPAVSESFFISVSLS